MKRFGYFLLLLVWCLSAFAETIPPAPAQYFNDYAKVVSPATADRLNRKLEQFERDTGNQIVVAIYPKMQSDSSIEDYTVRVAQAWGVGQKKLNNGAVLFLFIQDRQMFIQVGYGLEGALPDALCKQIIENELKPRFRAGDFDTGLSAGVEAMMAATKGEYKGTGKTVAEQKTRGKSSPLSMFVMMLLLLVFILSIARPRRRGWMYTGSGWGGGSGWGSSGGWGGGGGFSGGGGGFSGGGGSFGGGGAGGRW